MKGITNKQWYGSSRLPTAKPEFSTRLVGATLVKSSHDGCYELIRTSVEEFPEEERASSEDGYGSSEGSLSVRLEGLDSARSSMDAGAGVEEAGQGAASGPLGTFQHKLERTVTALPKPQVIVA